LDFVNLIVGDIESGYLEVRVPRQTIGKPSHGRRFFPVSDPVSVAATVIEMDRLDDALTCIAPGVRIEEGSGKPSNVGAISVVWADLDWKDYDDGQKGAHLALVSFPFRPACVIRSGRGYHAYWRLREPWVFEGPEDRAAARSILRRIAQRLGSDIATAQLGVILRAPGTLNRKLNPPVMAEITKWDPAAPALNLEDFDVLPAEESEGKDTSGDSLLAEWQAPVQAIVIDTLRVTKATLALIKFGAPNGADESSLAQGVITALLRSGYDSHAIRSVFVATQDGGIGNAWGKRGRHGDSWLAGSIAKAIEYIANNSATEAPTASDKSPWFAEDISPALARDIPPPKMIIDGMLREGSLSAIVAPSNVGKSWLADIIGFHLATGISIWGRKVPEPMSVLVVQEEMSDAETIDRLRKIRRTLAVSDDELARVVFRHVYQPGLLLTDPSPLVDALESTHYDVVIIDSYSATRGGVEENDNDGVGRLLQSVKHSICLKYNTHIIFIHHTRKVQGGKDSFDPENMERGAAAFKQWMDNMWTLHREKDQSWIKLYITKARGFAKPEKPMLIKLVDTDEGGVEMILVDNEGNATDGYKEDNHFTSRYND
jgi:hypothetical protein